MAPNRQILKTLLVVLFLGHAGVIHARTMEDVKQAVMLKDFEGAFRMALQLAKEGDAKAQYEVAIFYHQGTGVKRDNPLFKHK